jgi:hypothetical protein
MKKKKRKQKAARSFPGPCVSKWERERETEKRGVESRRLGDQPAAWSSCALINACSDHALIGPPWAGRRRLTQREVGVTVREQGGVDVRGGNGKRGQWARGASDW